MRPHEIQPFRVADALAAGRTRASIDSRHFEMPFHGIRAPLGSVDDLVTRCLGYQLRMRGDAAFTGLTAAELWGIPLPAGVDRSRLDVSVPHGSPRPRARGIRGSERSSSVDIAVLDGLRVVTPVETWAALGRVLPVRDLVATGDHLVCAMRGPAMATRERLAEVAARRSAGALRLRRALPFIRDRSLSRPESLLRLLLVACGVPEPSLNHVLPDVGAMLDLAWPDPRVGLEYHGDHHRDPAQFGADLRRQERIHDAEWLMIAVTRFDLFDHPRETVARVARRLASRGMRFSIRNPPIWALPTR